MLSGPPEFNAVFNTVDTILFEFADMQEIHKEAQSALESIFKIKIPRSILDITKEVEKEDQIKYSKIREDIVHAIVEYYGTNLL